MGAVYEALDLERGVKVALKTVLHRDPDALARFKNEFRALQGIHHPNLVALGELVGDARAAFFTMELVTGTDLVTWVRGETLPAPRSGYATVDDLHRAAPDDTDREPAAVDVPPPSHARPSTPPVPASFDEQRLRHAFRQVVVGLTVLHGAGKVHRDVKPSNVLVTPEGRVVLLDFGLVFDVTAEGATDTNVVGTPSYMSPEQTLGERVGPESDYYAVGAMLYLCLTGRLPFEGAAMAVLMAKQYQEPPPPSAHVTGLPGDLEQLCMDLLQCDPAARPSGGEIARRLSARGSKPPSAPPSASALSSAPFVGRSDEMSTARRALEDVTKQRRAVSVVFHGESGVGKSSLARRFLDEARAGGALVLTGRCYEREAVPYKAFDEVIDALSRRLARLPKEEALAVLPSRVEALAQLFPALWRVPAVSQAQLAPDRDVHERRRTAFRALRELLRKVAAQQPLVLAIDDLQWTDADSLSLLAELLRPPDAPPILLVVTLRASEDASHPSAPPPLVQQIPGDVRPVHVGRLAQQDARELAARLLERAPGAPHLDAAAIANEADGHPLFMDELVRAAAQGGGGGGRGAARLSLDDALWARVTRLDLAARRVLEVACVLGAPVAQEIVGTAAGMEMGELGRVVDLLRTANFVRTGGARLSDTLEPFHDRVREAVRARLDPDVTRECHARLASALELSRGGDHEVLATHWAGAGEPAKAARHAVAAAEQAAQALAFDRAARLFQRAIELVPPGDLRLRALREQLGDALACAGECARAAAEYARAAQGANPTEALDLRRRAAEQLLRAGEVRRGLGAMREVLSEVGIRMPTSRLGVVLALVWYRLVLRLRGLGFVPRDAKDVPQEELTRIDMCWSASCTVSYADSLAGALFVARHLLLALRCGEKLRATRALAIYGALLGATGTAAWPQAARTLRLAREAASRCAEPYADAIVSFCEGLARIYVFKFEEGVDLVARAIEVFRARCPGTDWEIATARHFLLIGHYVLGHFVEMRGLLESALKDAGDRGDRYAAVLLRVGMPNRVWVIAGDLERAKREVQIGTKEWPREPFQVVHYYQLVAECYIDLCEGQPERAAARLRATRRDLARSFLLQLEGVRIEHAAIAGRVALAVAAADASAGHRPDLREAERWMRVLERADTPVSLASLLSMRAGRAAVRGDRIAMLAHLDDLAGRDDTEETWLGMQCARWVTGALRGGEGDEARVREAKAALEARGVGVNEGLLRAQFPGVGVTLEYPRINLTGRGLRTPDG
jgi:serine/threonine protein kinase